MTHKNPFLHCSISKKRIANIILFFRFNDNPRPTEIGMLLPTIEEVPIKFTLVSIKCIEPPIPFEHPSFFPYNSAIIFLMNPLLLGNAHDFYGNS